MLLKNKRGLTLVEMMASVVIFGLVIVSSVNVMNAINNDSKEISEEMKEKKIFIEKTNEMLEELRYATDVMEKEEDGFKTLTYRNQRGERVSYIVSEEGFFEVRDGKRKRIAEIEKNGKNKLEKRENMIIFDMEIKNMNMEFNTKVVLRNE